MPHSKPTSAGGPVRLVLAKDLSMSAAEALKASLAVCRERDVELDGAGVDRLGGQCLQVLLAASRTWAEDGRRLSIVTPSPALLDHLDLLGVGPAPSPSEI